MYYNRILRKYPNKDYKIYFLVPKEPCVSCSSISYDAVIIAYEKNFNGIRFFLLDTSYKALRKRLNERILNWKNVVIDPDLQKNSNVIEYPTMIYLRRNTIKKIEYQNAKNPYGVNKLIKVIDEKK